MNEAKRFLAISACFAVAMLVGVGIMRTINWNNVIGGMLLVFILSVTVWIATLGGDS